MDGDAVTVPTEYTFILMMLLGVLIAVLKTLGVDARSIRLAMFMFME